MTDYRIKIINTILWVAVGFVICLCIFWRPWENVIDTIVTKPVETIKKEINEVVVPSQKKIDSFVSVVSLLKSENNIIEKNLWAAWKENERLNKKFHKLIKDTGNIVISLNGSADDFTEVLSATADSDSLCMEAIDNLNKQVNLKDSIIMQDLFINIALKKGFDEMVTNSLQKDAAMKQLNKKLKWQKLQSIGFKATAAVLIGLVIKNNIK